jgi:hypothetical protein
MPVLEVEEKKLSQIFSEGQSGWEMATWELSSTRHMHCAPAFRCDRQSHIYFFYPSKV